MLESVLLLVLPAMIVFASDGLSQNWLGTFFRAFVRAAIFGGPALFVGGLVLPLTFRLAAGGAVGPRLGGLLAANTLGGIVGSLGASFLLLDVLSLWWSLAAVGIAYGIASLLVRGAPSFWFGRAAGLAVIVGVVLLSPLGAARLPIVSLKKGDRLLAREGGAHGVVTVVQKADGDRAINIDNHYVLAGASGSALDTRAGHLPLLLHQDPKRVLFIGSATGSTAAAAVFQPVEQIVLVEIVPQVHDLAAQYFAEENLGVHKDPRTRLVVEDGRNHLRATAEEYDVIVSDLFTPWRRGVGSLYSIEHFRAAAAHLEHGGVFCQWLALYQLSEPEFKIIAATFLEVFPHATLWRDNFLAQAPTLALIGVIGPLPTAEQVDARARQLAAHGVKDRWVSDPSGVWMLYLGPLAALSAELAGVVPTRDDRPIFEYLAGRTPQQRRLRFVMDQWPQMVQRLAAARSRGGIPGARLDLAEAGDLFSEASRLFAHGQTEALRPVLRELRRRVPPHLLSPRDPLMADVWP